MPNGCDIPSRSLAPRFVGLNPVKFQYHFRVDDEGKCRLAKNDFEWKFFVFAMRNDWETRLSRILLDGGNAKDFQDSKTMFKTKL